MPSKSWFSVQAAAVKAEGGEAAADVSIRGYIGEWGVTDRDFISSLEAFGPVGQINLSINSRGGEVDHALSIFNHLRNHAARVNVRVDGVAMSAASIIAMAGDEIVMPANTVMMVHNPWAFAAGDAKALRKTADDLETFETALLETYMARTGKSEGDIRTLLDEETFMTAAEAVENGFADRVEPVGKNSSATAVAVAYASALGIPDAVFERMALEAQAAADDAADDAGQAGDGDAAAVGGDDAAAAAAQAALPAFPPSLASQIAVAAQKAGLDDYIACFALDASITDMDTAMAAMGAAREIHELCIVAHKPDMADALIRKRVTLADARAALLSALAEEDENSHTDGTLPVNHSKPLPGASPAVSTQSIWDARTLNTLSRTRQ